MQGRGPGPPIFLDQTEAQRAKKFWDWPCPPYLRVWMTPPAPYLKVWIRHCNISIYHRYIIRKNFSNRVIILECVLIFAPYMKAFLSKDHPSFKWKSIFRGYIADCTSKYIIFLQHFLTCCCHQLTQNSRQLYSDSSAN